MPRGDQTKSYVSKLVDLNYKTYTAIGYQKLTVNGTAAGLTIPTDAKYAEIKLESADTGVAARYLLLGAITLPTSTDGIGLSSLDVIDITGSENLARFKIIRAQSGTTTLHVQYYK